MKRDIYIVLSQTRSVVSRIIRFATGDAYTHVSICFGEDEGVMYSFGRLFPYNPLWGGFVRESVLFGTMKRFRDAKVAAVRIRLEESEYANLREYICSMYSRRRQYGYNYIGLFAAKFGVVWRWNNHYYCSEFLKELLEQFGIAEKGELSDAARPIEFLNLRRGRLVYCGSLRQFAAMQRS